jgi:DNA (cytosine-5)-methyltransferase 1
MVRRLTPTECERLQSLPDQWTLLEPSDDPNPKPDGPRYAACGDAVTSNVAEWIGRRLMAHKEEKPHA